MQNSVEEILNLLSSHISNGAVVAHIMDKVEALLTPDVDVADKERELITQFVGWLSVEIDDGTPDRWLKLVEKYLQSRKASK